MTSGTTLICADNGLLYGPYTEAIDLQALGNLNVQRATAIEFDNETQCWQVLAPAGASLFNSPSRQACLAWEQEHLRKEAMHPHEQRSS